MIGCSFGHLYSYLHYTIFPVDNDKDQLFAPTFAVLGATAFLAGATKLTYSLGALMFETSYRMELFLPIIFTLLFSFASSSLIGSKAPHLSALKTKDIPRQHQALRAHQMMSKPPVFFKTVVTVGNIYEKLQSTAFNGFPVTGDGDRFVGIIERDVLIVLIKKRAFYHEQQQQREFGKAEQEAKTHKLSVNESQDQDSSLENQSVSSLR